MKKLHTFPHVMLTLEPFSIFAINFFNVFSVLINAGILYGADWNWVL